jgi:D-xylose transport system permease protein
MSTPAQASDPDTTAEVIPETTPTDLPHSRREVVERIRTGDLGSLRVLILLAIIWTIFQVQESRFLSAVNLTNLTLQITAVGLISVGVVLVLLLGEIDLSVGAVSGLCAAILAVLTVKQGWGTFPALLVALGAAALIGTFQGFISTKFGIPTFVVTLAGLLGWQGVQLRVLGETGTVNLNPGFITDLTSKFLSDGVGWIIALIGIAAFAAATFAGRQRRVTAGLKAPSMTLLGVRVGAVALGVLLAVYVLNQDRGVPVALLILIGFVGVFDFLLRRTRWGRHVFSVGGNAEASRRAGISVSRIRISVFALASTMAAIGGIMAASRLLAVNQSSGGSDLLLLAIAGPVIAGTSLFGGRGSAWHALTGALVIGSISNGMDLLALASNVKFMVTGAVLLGAVILDSIARRGRAAAGRV